MLAAHHVFSFWTWLGHFTGTSDESGPGYGFFSGIGSDIGEVTLVAGAVVFWRRWRQANECHLDDCHRLAIHHVHHPDGTVYRVCRTHHPKHADGPITMAHVADAHRPGRAVTE